MSAYFPSFIFSGTLYVSFGGFERDRLKRLVIWHLQAFRHNIPCGVE